MSEIVAFFASLVIIIRSLCQLNQMTWKTRIWIKLPYWVMVISAGAILISPFQLSNWRDVAYACITLAVAMMLCMDNRVKNRLHHTKE